ncbi:CGI-121-domain-containing protein [Obba rivulosa]|uniref:EKC/KEOPS complex subunit CGI121 n=1 Tax=Obba rivulosa TaxID=1052685 RepID=A0A8E2DP80_9APHY|nr:CGI-121-domain-containing protein [Obba rivulosa]
METYHYPSFPADASHVHIALFKNVSNAAELRSRIVRASLLEGSEGDLEREAVNFAFIDARLICSRVHLQTAIYQAVLAHAQGALRTKTVHSEILWTLNPSNNISEAIRRYGVSDTTAFLIVVRISTANDANVLANMQAVVSGELSRFSLEGITDWASVKKYYKLNSEPALKIQGITLVQERKIIDEIVTSTVAMKSVMT